MRARRGRMVLSGVHGQLLAEREPHGHLFCHDGVRKPFAESEADIPENRDNRSPRHHAQTNCWKGRDAPMRMKHSTKTLFATLARAHLDRILRHVLCCWRLYCVIAGESPIQKDDPCIIGIAVGSVTSACAFLLAAADACGVSKTTRRNGYVRSSGFSRFGLRGIF